MNKISTTQNIELAEVDNSYIGKFPLIERNLGLVKDVKVEIEIVIGNMNISMDKLFSMKAGEVLTLDKLVDDSVEVVLNNNTIALGTLVAIDGRYGIEVNEVKG
jgi:flagellar motor switch protein FliN/FliY